MDPEPGITSLKPKPILRDPERPPAPCRRQKRITSPPTSRGIAKPSQKNTRKHTRSASTHQTSFRICRAVLFRARHDNDFANSDARVPSPISRDRPQASSDQAPAPASMHARGTKRSAEADEFELRLELSPGANGQLTSDEEGGMIGTATEAIHSGLDTMVGFFASTGTKLWAWLERSTPNRDAGNRDAGDVNAKRVKLSDDGHSEDSGSVRWKSESVNDSANSQLRERQWLPADRPYKPSIADGQTRPFPVPDTEASTIGTFASSAPLVAGSYPVDDSPDSAPTRMPGTASANGERGLDSSRTTQPSVARRPGASTDPRSRSQLYRSRMRLQGAAKPRLFHGPVAKSRLTNGGISPRLPLDGSPQPVSKDEAGGEKDSPSRDDDTSDKETPRPPRTPPTTPPATLTVFDNSEGILGTAEAFGELKISGDVTQREEERERKAREREEEIERQRVEREEEKRRLEEQRLREEAERRGGLRQPHKDLFPALSAEWTARVQRSLRPDSGDLARTPEAKLQSHDFERLVPSTVWLNDNIVNGTLLWLDRFINEAAGITDVKAKTRKCLMPGSFFFTRLLDHGVRGTERALRRLGVNKDNILDIETILMPICQVNHWTLVVVEPRKRRISHFDSLNPAGSDGKRALAKDWMRSVLGDSFVEEEWRFAKYRAPRQSNGWDCGVHTVLNGVCLGLGIEPSAAYSSDQLPHLRKRIAAVLLNQGFKGEFSLAGC